VSVRGYDKDEVNALLERAAQAIEALDAPIRELEAR
jgi:cell division septum initiation protein DivIVA